MLPIRGLATVNHFDLICGKVGYTDAFIDNNAKDNDSNLVINEITLRLWVCRNVRVADIDGTGFYVRQAGLTTTQVDGDGRTRALTRIRLRY